MLNIQHEIYICHGEKNLVMMNGCDYRQENVVSCCNGSLADVLFHVRSIRPIFHKCNNVMNNDGRNNNTDDATLFGSEFLMMRKHWSDK
jgi:hypothetical protein